VEARAARMRATIASGSVEQHVIVRDRDVVGELSLHMDGSRLTFGICLAREIRGRGWGRALLETAITRATERGAPTLGLDVYAHNDVARRLYESRGFVEVGTDIDDRGNGVIFDVISMELRLGRDR
jgi:ribosomal protein S18 acetylase RimI-like enzyme